MDRKNLLKIGICSKEKYKARELAIAQGKYVPAKDEPKVWLQSAQSLVQLLSAQNRALLRLIVETRPQSLTELAENTGRAIATLSRVLRALERLGLVHFERGPKRRERAPKVDYSGVRLEMWFEE